MPQPSDIRRGSPGGGLVGLLVTALVAAAAAVVVQVTTGAGPAAAAASEPYNWRNVEIHGGGFVPSIIFSPTQRDLIYARTDIGGAYRWNQSTGRWIPLLDWVGRSNWGWNGVASLATDPVDPNKVYVAAGMYTNSWDPNNGAILRSADKGATWQSTGLPFKLGGNMPGRGMGERLAVDPNRNSILYFGAPSGRGLWRSVDSGVTWSQVANFPNVGNYVENPAHDYSADIQGVVWVTFDKSSSTAGNATKAIYVGVADKENTVYRSIDAGATWERIAGQPTGYMAHKGVLDEVNHQLYIATSDTGGPYTGGKGDVWKYHTTTGVWTQISPVPSTSADNTFGYSGLTIDRQNPGTIMVGTQISWWPDTVFFRSTDGGATWTRAWDWAGYPNRTFRYKFDIASAPWVDLGANPSPPDTTPKLGWMNEGIEIDPFNSDRLMYGTGLTLYGTTDLTRWDTPGGQITIKPMAAGLEETAVTDLISPPSGPSLVSALGDIGGFTHADLTKPPLTVFRSPAFTTSTGLDYAGNSPNVLVRVGDFDKAWRPNDMRIAFSTDGGANWFQAQEPAGVTGGGPGVAAAADGSRFVWSPAGTGVHYTVGFGNTWTASTGIPAGAVVEADRVNPLKFYGRSGSTFYLSTDGGASFTATAAAGLPTDVRRHATVLDLEGDVWIPATNGLFHTTDSGATLTRLPNVTAAESVSLGRAAPGRLYPAVYIAGTVDGVDGVFRSDDIGANWVRINDDQHQYGNMGYAISGDPRVYGRVYLGTNGRGVLVADRLGGPVSPPPTTSPSPSRSPSPSPSPSVSPSPSPSASRSASPSPGSPSPSGVSPPPTGGCAAQYKIVSSWQGNFQGEVQVSNTGTAALRGWTVTWTFANGQVISALWGGIRTQTGANVSVRNESWNGNLAAGAVANVGFLASQTGTNAVPTNVSCTPT